MSRGGGRVRSRRRLRPAFGDPYTSSLTTFGNGFGDLNYRAPRVGIFTPADLRADADTLHGQVLALDNALSAHGGQISPVGIAFLNFENEWNAFYANVFDGLLGDFGAALDNGNRDQLIQFEDRFADLATKLAAEGVGMVEGIIRPLGSTPSLLKKMFGELSDEALTWIKWGAIAGGVGLGIYVAVTFAPLLKAKKKNPRRRRRARRR